MNEEWIDYKNLDNIFQTIFLFFRPDHVLIANVTLLHHRLNTIKHCFVVGQQSIDSCVNIVILTIFSILGWL